VGQRPDEIKPREIIVRIPPAADERPGREQPDAMPQTYDASSTDDATAAARGDIEVTRAEMATTIDAIQDRLDPEVLSEQARETAQDVTDYAIREAKEAAREITDHALIQARAAVLDVTGQAKLALREATIGKVEHMAHTASDSAGGLRQSVVATIKANPMPAALVGLGLGWMLLNRPGSSPTPVMNNVQGTAGQVMNDVQGTAGQVMNDVQGTAGQVMDDVQSTAEQVMDRVQGAGGQALDRVQEQTEYAQSFLQRQLQDNPLLVGAVAVAVGGALASTLHSTAREDQLLGQTRDRLMGRAADVTRETMDKVGRVVGEAQTAAKDAAREESLVPNTTPSNSTA
jgi:ElaB/YqjD/DUF883 family membrane-anchored ribosome-binding protein